MALRSGRSGLILLLVLLTSACITTSRFNTEIGQRDAKITSLESQIEDNETRIVDAEKRIETHDTRLDDLSKSSQAALDRAMEAGQLAKGKLVYEVVLSDDVCNFNVGSAELSLDCRSAIDDLILKLTNENPGVYLEIQGHTDSTGDELYNEQLGQRRAESVKRYLHQHGKIALHRMNIMSYGESLPLVDNDSAENRRLNRRVVIVVLE